MAAKTTDTIPGGYEEISVPRARADEDANLFIGINGVNYVLPKGKKSTVPKAVADEYRRSQTAQEALDRRIDEKQAQAAAN